MTYFSLTSFRIIVFSLAHLTTFTFRLIFPFTALYETEKSFDLGNDVTFPVFSDNQSLDYAQSRICQYRLIRLKTKAPP